MDNPNLDELREKIDLVDGDLITILAKRFRLTNMVGHYKAQHQLSAVDSTREQEQSVRYTQAAQVNDLNPELVLHLFQSIQTEVVKNHRAISQQVDSSAD
jgi:chorismate mutase